MKHDRLRQLPELKMMLALCEYSKLRRELISIRNSFGPALFWYILEELAKPTLAITRGRTGKNTATGVTTCSVTWTGGSTTTGSLLTAAISAVRTNGSSPTITPPAGWSQANTAREGSTGSNRTSLFYKENASAESSTGNFTSGACDWAIVVTEYLGVLTTAAPAPLDQIASATTTANPISTGTTPTTTQADEVCVGACGDGVGGILSAPTNSFSIVDQANGLVSVALLERIVAATSTYGTAVTDASSLVDGAAGVIGTFKAAAAAGGSTARYVANLMLVLGLGRRI